MINNTAINLLGISIIVGGLIFVLFYSRKTNVINAEEMKDQPVQAAPSQEITEAEETVNFQEKIDRSAEAVQKVIDRRNDIDEDEIKVIREELLEAFDEETYTQEVDEKIINVLKQLLKEKNNDFFVLLRKYKELWDDNIITEEEYEKVKEDLMKTHPLAD